jgi:hypothetical protein
MKVKCLIMDIEKRVDKNSKDYWIIRTRLDKNTTRDYLAFSQDYQLAPKALSLLMNYSYQLVNDWVVLTVKKNNDREKVIRIEK